MVGQIVAVLEVARLIGQAPKPPVAKYDAVRDVTVYSTGDVQTAGYAGYGAKFEFPGKTPAAPASIGMSFGALRLPHGQEQEQDQTLLHWKDVKTVTLSFGGQKVEFSAAHAFKVSTNKQVTMFLGRGLEESLSISLTVAQFTAVSGADSIQVQLGKDTQLIKGKSLAPLKRLAACIPAS